MAATAKTASERAKVHPALIFEDKRLHYYTLKP
jgi:hypothetical protein